MLESYIDGNGSSRILGKNIFSELCWLCFATQKRETTIGTQINQHPNPLKQFALVKTDYIRPPHFALACLPSLLLRPRVRQPFELPKMWWQM